MIQHIGLFLEKIYRMADYVIEIHSVAGAKFSLIALVYPCDGVLAVVAHSFTGKFIGSYHRILCVRYLSHYRPYGEHLLIEIHRAHH